MKISTLMKKRATAVVDLEGEQLTVGFNPKAFSTELQEQFEGAAIGGGALAGMLAKVLTDWDLEDDEGKPVPVTEDVLRGLAITDLGAIFAAVGEQLNPNSTSATSTSG